MLFRRGPAASILLAAAFFCQIARTAPPLVTIQDTIYKADGSLFNGSVTIEWRSFDASDLSFIAKNRLRVEVKNGNLNVRLVPTTTAASSAYYSVKYISNGNIQFAEAWAVPPSVNPLRVINVRIPDPLQNPGAGGLTGPIDIDDVNGLQNELNIRAVKSPIFAPFRSVIINGNSELEAATGNPGDCLHVDGSSGPCGSGGGGGGAVVGTFVDGEIPSGAVDGSNSNFTLTQAPNPAASLLLYRNGILQKRLLDYNLTGTTASFLPASLPQSGDILLASYRTAGTGSTIAHVLCTGVGSATNLTTMTSLGSCTIPAGLLQNGDRVEVIFDYSHEGTTTAFQYEARFGSTTMVSRSGAATVTLATGKSSLGVYATGQQWSVLSWGTSTLTLASDAGTSAQNVANAITIDLRGQMSAATTDTVTLRTFTVTRYPAP